MPNAVKRSQVHELLHRVQGRECYCFRKAAFILGLAVALAGVSDAQPGVFGGVTGPPPALGAGTGAGFGIRPFVTLNGNYTSNLTDSASYDSTNNRFRATDTFGASITGGVGGVKQFRRTSLGIMYRGMGRYSGSSSSFSTSHFLSLSVIHQATPRLSLSGYQLAGTAEGGVGFGALFGGLGSFTGFNTFQLTPGLGGSSPLVPALGNPEDNGLVDNEVLDTRTYFASSSGSATYRLSERWSVTGGGAGFFVRRQQNQFGVNGFMLRGGANYAINSRAGISIIYTFSRFDYVKAYNNTQLNTLGGSFSYTLSPRTSFDASGGVVRWHSDFVGIVPLDPLLAALLGQPFGLAIQKLDRLSYFASGSLGHQFQYGSLNVYYRRGAVPGNGLLLGSEREVAGASYGYSDLDRWTFGATGGYASARGVVQRSYTTTSYSIRGNIGYRFYRGFSLRVGGGLRVLQLPTQPNLNQALAYVGIAWSPGEIPIVF